MLRLKKKKQQEKQEAEDKAAAAKETGTAEVAETKKVSLLGVGGIKKKKSGSDGKDGKKRTASEIRIQKGVCILFQHMITFMLHDNIKKMQPLKTLTHYDSFIIASCADRYCRP